MEEGYYSDTKGCKCFVKIGVGWKDNRAIELCPLHAAAEELLEACRDTLDILECNCGLTKCRGACTRAIVEAAIAKAESK